MQRDWRPIEVPYFRVDEAAEVLARAFAADSIVAQFVPLELPDRHAALRLLCKSACMARLSLHQPLIGAEWNNKIVAVACVKTTFTPTEPESMKRMWKSVAEAIGDKGAKRLDEFVATREKHLPPRKHYYLVALGVDPEYQSMGFGRLLLERVVDVAREDSTAAGVMLETDGEKNLVFYERNGFATASKEDFNGVEVLFMYRALR